MAEDCFACAFNTAELKLNEQVDEVIGLIHPLLRTNDAPGQDHRAIRQFRDDANAHLEKLDRVQKAGEELVGRVVRARQRLRRGVELSTRVLHPLRDAPVDVLIMIFEWCSGDHHHLDTSLAPWSISQVCRRWREIALSHAPLWTHLSYSKELAHPDDHYIMLLHLCIRRSVNCRLQIAFSDYEDTFFFMVLPQSERWEVVHARPSHRMLGIMEKMTFPSLKQLFIRLPVVLARPVQLDAPGIEVVDAQRVDLRYNWRTIRFCRSYPVPVAQLHRIEILDITFDESLYSLKPGSFTLPYLRVANLIQEGPPEDGCSGYIKHFFDCVTMPMLQKVSLRDDGDDWSDYHLLDSARIPKTLQWVQVDTSDPEWDYTTRRAVMFLKNTPNVHTIAGQTFPNIPFADLDLDGPVRLLPNLRHFYVCKMDIDSPELIALIKSRHEHGSPLSEIWYCKAVWDAARSTLEDLEDRTQQYGVKLVLKESEVSMLDEEGWGDEYWNAQQAFI
ncbi:hypothetical protein CYLTODRAFT_494668 [Cylindrobasidium torrendii FP15055 ss-10]|uniref:F-box domain-containing protein n=1 Tax=Cylindrobasidium torrendii FP15055 ss-10 TaxID=1314674 RepID=A0A0D7AYP5_9AGAR|nr:hypothetical protein CYLTODRAFT_494668 [Cylindrobasidium torrendii FP15055 ss-10]